MPWEGRWFSNSIDRLSFCRHSREFVLFCFLSASTEPVWRVFLSFQRSLTARNTVRTFLMRSFDCLEWIWSGRIMLGWVTTNNFVFLFLGASNFWLTIFNHLLSSQVSNPPFGESLRDCSLKGLEDHRQIGRRNVCQLFSEWCFCHNSTYKKEYEIVYNMIQIT